MIRYVDTSKSQHLNNESCDTQTHYLAVRLANFRFIELSFYIFPVRSSIFFILTLCITIPTRKQLQYFPPMMKHDMSYFGLGKRQHTK